MIRSLLMWALLLVIVTASYMLFGLWGAVLAMAIIALMIING